MRAIWTCPTCGHEALAYDEIDHECEDGKDFVAQGDELASKAEAAAEGDR